MTTFIGYVLAGLIVLSLIAIATVLVGGAVVTSSTVRANRNDQVLRDDLDRTLDEILGVRTPEVTA